MQRDKFGRFVKGNIPPYAGGELPSVVKAKLRAKALTPRRLEISIANLHPNGINVAKRPDIREKIAEAQRGHTANPETKQKMAEAHKKRYENPDLRQQISTTLKEFCRDPSVRQRKAKASMGRPQSASERAKKAEASKRKWQEPEFISRIVRAWHRRPTEPELILKGILDRTLPQFQYNGDLRLGIIIGGLIPDFPNVNGKKEIIELYGDYWHSSKVIGDNWRRSELGRIMTYNSLGWKCLILWEHEIKHLSEDEIVEKIQSSFRIGRQNARTS